MQAVLAPTAAIQSRTVVATNSGPLSERMYSGGPLRMKRSIAAVSREHPERSTIQFISCFLGSEIELPMQAPLQEASNSSATDLAKVKRGLRRRLVS